ncbi:MAG: HAD family hydrolase [Oricola sp.]
MKVFFDVDGVLIDGWHADEAKRKPWDVDLERDLGVDSEAFQTLFFGLPGARAGAPMMECVSGRRDLKEALAEILPQAGYAGPVDDFVRYWFEKDSNLDPQVLALAEELASNEKTDLFLATGQEHHRARYLWDDLGLSRLFSDIFYSARLGCLKKEPAFFAAINAELGIGPDERPLYFDDQPEIVALARKAGWDATHFTGPEVIRSHPRLRRFLE